jgi:DNA mismatch repair ATPase MutS
VTISLLHPDGAPPRQADSIVAGPAIRDLELDRLAADLAGPGVSTPTVQEILSRAPSDVATIQYRQDIVRDLRNSPALVDALAGTIGSMQELTVFSRSASAGTHPLLESVWRLSELEIYVDLVERLYSALRDREVTSAGLVSLQADMEARRSSPAFAELRTELPSLRAGLKLRRSLTIGINLDERLRPVQAALISVNDRAFEERQFLSRFFGAATGNPYVTQTTLHTTAEASLLHTDGRDRLPLAPLFQELESVLRSVLRPMARQLRDFVSVNTGVFTTLLPELAFFCGAVSALGRLEQAGNPLVFPRITDPSDRVAEFRGLYNLRLAAHRVQSKDHDPVVGNDLLMNDRARIFVLTGPNGGGKTTFTQAAGMAVVLAQAGLPVPATDALISPADRIVTHFPVEEDYDDDLGRFEDEVRRVSAVFDAVTERTLVLLNEPLTSTGPAEAIEIAGDVLAGFALAGVRGIFTTHFHQLAAQGTALNEEVDGLSRIGTLSAGLGSGSTEERGVKSDPSIRTYRIEEGPPEGSSHARDVAVRFRIDRQSLVRRIRPG